MRLISIVVTLLFIMLQPLRAQLNINLRIERTMHILFEPIIATIHVQNLSGREITLGDNGSRPWLAFKIQNQLGYSIALRQPNYSVPSIVLQPGAVFEREINLTPLYALDTFGSYKIQASVFVATLHQYFSSQSQSLELTDGRSLRKQSLGDPADGSLREVTLLTHRHPTYTALYLRIMDPNKMRILCTHRLGRVIAFGEPELDFDICNTIHILHRSAPRNYVYSHIGINGEIIERKAYFQSETRPTLEKLQDGQIRVVGGTIYNPAIAAPQPAIRTISERPVPTPSPLAKNGKKRI